MANKKLLRAVLAPGTLQMQIEEQPLEPQTWTSDVLVPLAQNVCGGIAVGVLGFIGLIAYSEWQPVIGRLMTPSSGVFWPVGRLPVA